MIAKIVSATAMKKKKMSVNSQMFQSLLFRDYFTKITSHSKIIGKKKISKKDYFNDYFAYLYFYLYKLLDTNFST